METSPLIYSANQWTGFYMIRASPMKALNNHSDVEVAATESIVTLCKNVALCNSNFLTLCTKNFLPLLEFIIGRNII